MKKLKAYIEIHKTETDYPTISLYRPFKREIKNSNSFGYKVYECEILLGKEIK